MKTSPYHSLPKICRTVLRRASLLLLCLSPCLVTAADSQPNFIVILTDDQGYGDLGCYGATDIKTPHIDRMAEEGILFSDFYAGAPLCSASRAALLTGRYYPRTGVPDVLRQGGGAMRLSEITIAETLRPKGYATTCIGKWHLGFAPKWLPTQQGFDSFFGLPFSNDMAIDYERLTSLYRDRYGLRVPEAILKGKESVKGVPLYENDLVVEWPVTQSTMTRRFTERSVRFIREHANQPFFLYLAHPMPHKPLAASKRFLGSSQRGIYGDALQELDWSVGEILATLKELGIDEQTLVIYLSDNGPKPPGQATPLRGQKSQTWEGGIRVPCVMRWPGRLPASTRCTEVATSMDLLPTIAALAGADLPQDRIIDGRDLRPLIMTETAAASPHLQWFYCYQLKAEALREGHWKFRAARKKVKAADGDWEFVEQAPELYDLKADVSETTNLTERYPERVREMRASLGKFNATLETK